MAATTTARSRLPELAKYQVLEEIGHGGMATVYRAHDPRLSRDVALKVIHPHLRDSHEAKTRFHAEAKAVAMLRHPNIVEVFDVSTEEEGEQYLVVELVRGDTLRKIVRDRGPLPPEIAASIGVELLAALAHAHAMGVVHRDIKPENVMIERTSTDASPEHVVVKLMDFGIAKLLDAQGVTSTGQVLGSPAHMAPEQIEGGDVDARADLFGLGVLLYEAMVGHLPFEGNNPAQVLRRVLEGLYPSADRERPTVGKTWSLILDRALAHDPDDRFADATEMRAAITRELETLGVASARGEIVKWLADPDAYDREHGAAMIAKLCALGRESRARGDALDAASRFNRALAYAPDDPQLLKIVASMHRASVWRSIAARAAPVALLSIALGTGAYFVTRAIRARSHDADLAASRATAIASAAPPASASAAPIAPASASVTRAVPAPVPIRPAPPPAPRPAVQRTITIDSVNLPFGVLVSVDGQAAGEATPGRAIPVDGKPHDLVFSCASNACFPLTKNVPAGEDPQVPMAVRLDLKPATVVVDGDPAFSYGLVDHPEIALRVGVPASVPVSHKTGAYAIERTSGRKVFAWLNPGQETHFDFTKSAAP